MAIYKNAIRAKNEPESIDISPMSNRELVNNYQNSNESDPSRRLIDYETISKIHDNTASEKTAEYVSAVYRVLHN